MYNGSGALMSALLRRRFFVRRCFVTAPFTQTHNSIPTNYINYVELILRNTLNRKENLTGIGEIIFYMMWQLKLTKYNISDISWKSKTAAATDWTYTPDWTLEIAVFGKNVFILLKSKISGPVDGPFVMLNASSSRISCIWCQEPR